MPAAGARCGRRCSGRSGVVVGLALSSAGYDANAVQSEDSLRMIRVLWCGLPIVFWTSGILLFLRFPLDAAEHARIRAEIDARSEPG
jgi:Na+/melibiose symporter-like transporter